MAATGIPRIDDLASPLMGAATLGRGDPDRAAVGALQDLLICHGASLPGILGTDHGVFGPRTERALTSFQRENGLEETGSVDHSTLKAIVEKPAPAPVAAQAYLALVLDLPWTGLVRLVALTAQFEAAGKFTACNRNTDRAGLSFGIIQWAQKPRRLNELLVAFRDRSPDDFVSVFGDGDPELARGLVEHTAKPQGGVDSIGRTTDPRFDLSSETWVRRFVAAGRDRGWQVVQIERACAAFRHSLSRIRQVAPGVTSERGLAFLLDVANQHGDGGMADICRTVAGPGQDERRFLQAAAHESVRRLKAQFGANSNEAKGTQVRRERFLTTPFLSDDPFVED